MGEKILLVVAGGLLTALVASVGALIRLAIMTYVLKEKVEYQAGQIRDLLDHTGLSASPRNKKP